MATIRKVIGRQNEKERLDKMLLLGQSDFLAVYGRRRVGKTFLIRQYLQDHIVFDFTGTRDGKNDEQLHNFFDEYLKRTKGQKETQPPASWQMAFKYLADYLQKLPATPVKKVVFIDEMPWIDTPKSGFVSALEFFWNQHVSAMDNILLIACGSATSWIKKKLINARGGLYNRVTQRMKLLPFNLHETTSYLTELGVTLPRYQILEIYMAMGGIPFYLKEITKGKTATQLIDEICFSANGLLYSEYAQLYHSLFKNADNHIAIIESLAAKPQGISRATIAAASKLNEGSLSRALEELVECDFVSIYQPFINKKKESIYKLTDLYSLFYLKFIKSNKISGSGTWEQLAGKSSYAAWSGYAFENICMLHIDQIKSALGIRGVYTQCSSWKFKGNDTLGGTQIDMLIDRADQAINLCEAKFTRDNFAITNTYAAQLRMKESIFRQATKTRKAIFTTLITTYPAIRNKYYLEEVEQEITMDKLFEPRQ
jgi:uncharacterized protein